MRTASAGAVVALGAIAIGSGRLFGLIELYVLGTGLILGVVVAAIHVRTRFVHIALERTISPTHPIAGDEVTVTLTLDPLRRTPSCDLVDKVGDEGRIRLTLAPLARRRTARVQYRVPTMRRGTFTLGPAAVELSDPLGLLGRRRTIGTSTDVIVHPRWSRIDLPDPLRGEGELVDFIRRQMDRMSVNLEFRSLREYVTGDDLRRINWKASARRDVLTLNEYEARAPLVVHLFLDDDESACSDTSFERAVSVAASFIGSAGARDRDSDPRVHISIPSSLETLIDVSTRLDAMRCLAEIEPATPTASPECLNDPGEFRVNVIVCGRRDRQWLESADRAMGAGHAVVVVHTNSSTQIDHDHDHWFTLPCPDFSKFATRWSTLSRLTADR